uniref:Uncharacterized protein n=1 Tax=Oryza sativa subsp. japonica TaxID=39947 RepID=Q109W3_ORYSJ|nr:hypothetical protein LOC_Os10g15279 [Oryza sativa Japonica Group]
MASQYFHGLRMYTLRGLTPAGKLFNLTGEFSSTSHAGGNKKTTKEQCTITSTFIPRSLDYEKTDAQGTRQNKCKVVLHSCIRIKAWYAPIDPYQAPHIQPCRIGTIRQKIALVTNYQG